MQSKGDRLGSSATLVCIGLIIALFGIVPLLQFARPSSDAPPPVGDGPEGSAPSGLVHSSADVKGNYILVDHDKKRVRVRDLVWGVSKDNYITIALLDGVMDDGSEIRIDQVEKVGRLAFAPEDLVGGKMMGGDGTEYVVDQLEYAVDTRTGLLIISAFAGHDAAGNAASYGTPGLAPPPICCQQVPLALCRSVDCTGSCPSVSNCECTGSGECGIATFQTCGGQCGVSPCDPGSDCVGSPPVTQCSC
jgi:hypothetical protein